MAAAAAYAVNFVQDVLATCNVEFPEELRSNSKREEANFAIILLAKKAMNDPGDIKTITIKNAITLLRGYQNGVDERDLRDDLRRLMPANILDILGGLLQDAEPAPKKLRMK
jgi:hypothetical protein